ncbi:hypothetical protein EHYA_05351 [Embleya hyalina]|uniref:Uncharacterized protein n=1 Tax=Embleya hyalina TaxID=516124 RepID=A0A401YSY2_9ACTN|nr:hypothetical protein EHYA_05351 [Embleya hyalina]
MAGGPEIRGADLRDRVHAVLDEGALDGVDGHGRQGTQNGGYRVAGVVADAVLRDGVDGRAAAQGECHLDGGPGFGDEGLVDRDVLPALDDPLHGFAVGVLARDGGQRLDAGGLEGGEDAEGEAVVGRVDAVETVRAHIGDGGGHVGEGVLRYPPAGVVRLDDLRPALEGGERTPLQRCGVRVGGVAVHHHDPRFVRPVPHRREQCLGLEPADLLRVVAGVRRDGTFREAVVRDHGDARVMRPCDRGAQRLVVDRVEDHRSYPVGDHGIHLLLLGGHIPRGVGVFDHTVGAQLPHLRLDQGLVGGGPARGVGVGKQQADGEALRVRLTATGCRGGLQRAARDHTGDEGRHRGSQDGTPDGASRGVGSSNHGSHPEEHQDT